MTGTRLVIWYASDAGVDLDIAEREIALKPDYTKTEILVSNISVLVSECFMMPI